MGQRICRSTPVLPRQPGADWTVRHFEGSETRHLSNRRCDPAAGLADELGEMGLHAGVQQLRETLGCGEPGSLVITVVAAPSSTYSSAD
jgi:hypothetical protein